MCVWVHEGVLHVVFLIINFFFSFLDCKAGGRAQVALEEAEL